jgi:hypothetical protein
MNDHPQRRICSVSLWVVLFSLLAFGASRADATPFCNVQGCAEFPSGVISFADAVVDYSPIFVAGNPGLPYRGAFNALGAPDFADPTGAGPCVDQASCTYVTLGDGGSLTLRFLNNVLTGSGNSNLDLWIFEVGGDVEDTFVEISGDGSLWHPVGKVFGSTAGIDIDAFGFGLGSTFSYIRLVDDPNEGEQSGTFVGADIDAVGAISTLAAPTAVPEPSTLLLLSTGIVTACRKRLAARFRR